MFERDKRKKRRKGERTQCSCPRGVGGLENVL
jgi:hypothetical protein